MSGDRDHNEYWEKPKMITPDGAQQIAIERNRQIQKEGWTTAHDDKHRDSALNHAARSYLLAAIHKKDNRSYQDKVPPYCWPWAWKWWKPSDDPVRDLVKAGALIAAEIDRLQRLKAKSQNTELSSGGTADKRQQTEQAARRLLE